MLPMTFKASGAATILNMRTMLHGSNPLSVHFFPLLFIHSISGNRYDHRWCYLSLFILSMALHSKFSSSHLCKNIYRHTYMQTSHIHATQKTDIEEFPDISRFETKARLPHKPEVSTYRPNLVTVCMKFVWIVCLIRRRAYLVMIHKLCS